jgi:hypothetical protein
MRIVMKKPTTREKTLMWVGAVAAAASVSLPWLHENALPVVVRPLWWFAEWAEASLGMPMLAGLLLVPAGVLLACAVLLVKELRHKSAAS